MNSDQMTTEEKDERLYSVIENVIAHMHKRVPPDEQLQRLRDQYPSPAFLLESNQYMLARAGLSRIDAFYFTMIPGLTRRVMREAVGEKPRLNTVSAMAEYLKGYFIGVHIECFYLICLDRSGKLMDTILLQKGTTDSAPFYMKQTLSIAVQKEAKAIVLCHNHPGGTLRPSKEDLMCTLKTLNALSALDMPMLDHIIIAGGKAVSIRESGLIPTALWSLQMPKSSLVRNWLDKPLL